MEQSGIRESTPSLPRTNTGLANTVIPLARFLNEKEKHHKERLSCPKIPSLVLCPPFRSTNNARSVPGLIYRPENKIPDLQYQGTPG